MNIYVYGERRRELVHALPGGREIRIRVSASRALDDPGKWEPARISVSGYGAMAPEDLIEHARAQMAALDVARALDALDPAANDIELEAESRLQAFLELPAWARTKVLARFGSIERLKSQQETI